MGYWGPKAPWVHRVVGEDEIVVFARREERRNKCPLDTGEGIDVFDVEPRLRGDHLRLWV